MLNARYILFKGRQVYEDALKKELRDQGHYLTGKAESSLTVNYTERRDNCDIAGEGIYYIGILHAGVTPDRIPFGGAGTGAKTSKYIQGLVNFWRLRGLSEKQALSAAFATAKKHKKEGMPTKGSYAFSSNGRRKFNLDVIRKVGPEVEKAINQAIDEGLNDLFNQIKNEEI